MCALIPTFRAGDNESLSASAIRGGGRPVGNRRIYQLDPTGVSALRAYLDEFWNQALASFKQAAERKVEEDR